MSKINKAYFVYLAGKFYGFKTEKEAKEGLAIAKFYNELNLLDSNPPMVNSEFILRVDPDEKDLNSLLLKDLDISYSVCSARRIKYGYCMAKQFDPYTRKVVDDDHVDGSPKFCYLDADIANDYGDRPAFVNASSRAIEVYKPFKISKCDGIIDHGSIKSVYIAKSLIYKKEDVEINHYIEITRTFGNMDKYKEYENMKLAEFKNMVDEDSKYLLNEYNTMITNYTKKTATRIKKILNTYEEIYNL